MIGIIIGTVKGVPKKVPDTFISSQADDDTSRMEKYLCRLSNRHSYLVPLNLLNSPTAPNFMVC
jgi:hypothetical protein